MDTASIAATTASAPKASPAGKDSGKGNFGSDFEMFLKMLTAQMTNQDPLNPIESSDYAVQLATFSSVEQQVQTNDLLQGLSTQLGLSSMAQLAGWVGQEARAAIPGKFDGSPITVAPKPADVADDLRLDVRDASGALVQSVQIPVSSEPYRWTGRTPEGGTLPNGTYSFDVVSLANGSELSTEPAEIYQRIAEVQTIAGQVSLIFEGGEAAPAGAVTAIRTSRD